MNPTPLAATIVVFGISESVDRYSYKAYRRLLESGYTNLFGVNPSDPKLPGITTVKNIGQVSGPIDTITMYVHATIIDEIYPEIVRAKPRRIILNPGTEHEGLKQAGRAAGIDVTEACTLVLLGGQRF
jgi:hypothetical protein